MFAFEAVTLCRSREISLIHSSWIGTSSLSDWSITCSMEYEESAFKKQKLSDKSPIKVGRT
jgi:hypothetical protein